MLFKLTQTENRMLPWRRVTVVPGDPLARFKRYILHVPNVINIWFDPKNNIRKLILDIEINRSSFNC